MFVIGTAGHVDHGKSALVRALSGIDPDRLPEEKHRGMTIDLGFASLRLPGGTDVSIVDVPGHERFIKNMLAGVGGIDLALLVVAADEGIMPQTREHLAILDLLGVACGVVALTKRDLVDDDWLDLVAADVEELVGATALRGSPIVHCSATTGVGLDELMAVLESRLNAAAPRKDRGRPRLPIDRVFSVAGFGTVVTGTLVDGELRSGAEVEIVPTAANAGPVVRRIRGIQNHNAAVETALPGMRTAVNLAGAAPTDLSRGQVLTTPGWLEASTALDVRLRVLPSLGHALRHNLNVTFHSLAAEAPARLRLLEGDEVRPGDEAWTQLRLYQPAAAVTGDRFIIRDSNETVGGGVIVATQAKRHPRNRPEVIAALARSAEGDPADVLYAAIAGMEPALASAVIARSGLSVSEGEAGLAQLIDEVRVVVLQAGDGCVLYTAEGFARAGAAAAATVTQHLERRRLRAAMAKEELRSQMDYPARRFDAFLAALVEHGFFERRGNLAVAVPGWAPRLTTVEEQAVAAFVDRLRVTPFSPSLDPPLPPELLAYLVDAGEVVDVGDGVVFAAEAYDEMLRRVITLLEGQGAVTMAEVRDLLGSSRKYVQALLEHMDRERITLRQGDARVLRSRPARDDEG